MWGHVQEVAPGKPHYNVGFIGINDGRGAIFSFVDFWADQNELHHHVFISPKDEVEKLEYRTPIGLTACVWDAALIAFDRQAWVDTMLDKLDDFVSDRMLGATGADSAAWKSAAGTWRAGDSIPKAERLDEAAGSHRSLQEALGLRPSSGPSAAEEALIARAREKEAEIMAGGDPPGEKARMVFDVRQILAAELKKLRAGRR